jgi:D-glycero-alpha-D-manno-heptose-7-phosphate kinase
VEVTPLALSDGAQERLQANLLLCYTGTVRTNLGLIDTQVRMYREGREETILGMKKLHELAYRMRDAISAGDVDELGSLLNEAYESKKQMNPRITDETPIESLFAVARAAGTSGGKICGAGGGGFLLLACRPGRQAAVRAALEAKGGRLAPFSFVHDGARATRGSETWAPEPA